MDVDAWLAAAVADAERRGFHELKPMLETLARSLTALRAADEEHRGRERSQQTQSSTMPNDVGKS
jgi:hypothetical protein